MQVLKFLLKRPAINHVLISKPHLEQGKQEEASRRAIVLAGAGPGTQERNKAWIEVAEECVGEERRALQQLAIFLATRIFLLIGTSY